MSPAKPCSTCGTPLLFLLTGKGRRMPVDAASVVGEPLRYDPSQGHIGHWLTCPDAAQHRRRQKGGSDGPAN